MYKHIKHTKKKIRKIELKIFLEKKEQYTRNNEYSNGQRQRESVSVSRHTKQIAVVMTTDKDSRTNTDERERADDCGRVCVASRARRGWVGRTVATFT